MRCGEPLSTAPTSPRRPPFTRSSFPAPSRDCQFPLPSIVEVQTLLKWILSAGPFVQEANSPRRWLNFQSSVVVSPLNETIGRGGKGNSLAKFPCPPSESDGSAGQSVAAFSIPEVIWGVSARARACAHVSARRVPPAPRLRRLLNCTAVCCRRGHAFIRVCAARWARSSPNGGPASSGCPPLKNGWARSDSSRNLRRGK